MSARRADYVARRREGLDWERAAIPNSGDFSRFCEEQSP